jgi:hypothetical protein
LSSSEPDHSEDEWKEDEHEPSTAKRSSTSVSAPSAKKARKSGAAGLVGMTVPVKDAAPIKAGLTGDALERRVDYRLTKLNKQIKDRLKWKASYKKFAKDGVCPASPPQFVNSDVRD